MHTRCAAFRESFFDKSVVYVPCSAPVKAEGKDGRSKRRFCITHERAYREILLGILMQGRKEPNDSLV